MEVIVNSLWKEISLLFLCVKLDIPNFDGAGKDEINIIRLIKETPLFFCFKN